MRIVVENIHYYYLKKIMKLTKQRVILFCIGLAIILGLTWILKPSECLRIAAGREGGDSHNFALLMEKFVSIYSDNKICINVVGNSFGVNGKKQTDGTQENLEMLEKKEADLATAQADILIMKNLPSLSSVNGKPWNPPFFKEYSSAQIVSLLFPDTYQLVVRNDSNIKTVSDLANDKLVAMPPREGGQIESFAFLMQHYGLVTEKEQLVKLVDVGNTNKELKDALCNQKEVDAVFFVRVIDNEKIREVLIECGRLVPIDQAAALTIKNPYLQEMEIPEGAYRGGNNPIPNYDSKNNQKLITVSTPRLLLANKDVDKEKIKIITRIFYEHRQEFIKEMPSSANISPPDNMKGGIGLPIHPGSQAYYDRDKPSWLERYADILALLIALVTLMLPAFFWITKRIEQIRKNKADDYIREVNALMDAQDCIQIVTKYLDNLLLSKAQQPNPQARSIQTVISHKTAKILVEKRVAELARQKNLISNDSLVSFSKTLRQIIKAVEILPSDLAEEIFNITPQKAMEIINERQTQRADRWQKLFGITSINELVNTEKNKLNQKDLESTLNNVKNIVNNNTFLQDKSKLTEFMKDEIMEIRRDLDAIFKRAVNALVEERITQESFQSFRVIWQIAIDDVN